MIWVTSWSRPNLAENADRFGQRVIFTVVSLSSPDEVIAALADGKPTELIGTPESSQIDFKESAYQLDSDKGKWELAKDVAGLANLDGGVLVVGVRTTKTEGKFLDLASELRPVPVQMLDKDKHHSIIRDLVRPGTVVFDIACFRDPEQASKGYMTIHVRPLPQWDRPALIRRVVTSNDKLFDAVNIPIRDSDQTRWLSGDECYQLLRDGQRANVSPGTGGHATKPAEALNWDEALDRLIAYKDWESPVLAWQSMPTSAADLLPKMWGEKGISRMLRSPNSLRPYGFNWYFLSETIPFEDGVLATDGRHAIWVRENGSVVAAATVGVNDVLGWAMRNSPGQPQRLNAIAVSELTLEYFRLVDQNILPIAGANYVHSIATRRFSEEPTVVLAPRLPTEFPPMFEHHATQDRRREFSATVPADAERDAYEALRLLYASFQHSPDMVPFIKDGRIDTEALLEWARTH